MRTLRLPRMLSLASTAAVTALLGITFAAPASAAAAAVTTSGSATTGATIALDSRFTAPSGQAGNYVVDTEAYNASGARVGQWFETVYLDGSSSVRRYNWSLSAVPAGTYRFSQGIFNPNWAGNRYWQSNAGSVTISTPPTAPSTTTTPGNWDLQSTSAVTTSEANGTSVAVGTSFTMVSNFSPSNVILNTEVVNGGGHKVAQWAETAGANPSQRFDRSYIWNASSAPAGTYIVRQGVFTADWSRNYVWRGNTATFVVGSSTAQAAPASTTTTAAPTTTTTTTKAPTTTTTAPSYSAASSSSTGNPFSGVPVYVNPNNPAASQAAAWRQSRPGDAAVMDRISAGGAANWLGGWNTNIQGDVSRISGAAAAQNRMPIFVAYNIPGRDCGSYSAGGASGSDAYRQWIRSIAAGIGSNRAAVILEPDALSQLDCLDASRRADRLALLSEAVNILNANGRVAVYLDAGHPGWHSASAMADRLRQANVAGARGFALNVSNYSTTSSNVTYGNQVSSLLGGKKYIVDTSRNGNGGNGQWCNAWGRALGEIPTANTGVSQVDAYLWVKQPGESDGNCNGGPGAGQWWADYALDLGRNAGY